MCGIVGYIGAGEAYPVLIDGLTKLEYRGYDSAGVAIFDNKINVSKSVGRLSVLEESLKDKAPKGNVGIGHTRWATHGKPSDENSHPHTDCTGKFAVVHNGIIENYLTLKEELIAEGHVFKSETDTEVIPHLIEKMFNGDFEATVREVAKILDGSYAIAAIYEGEPDKIVVVRKDSPLIIGLGDGENYIASDIPAVLSRTKNVYILNDGEVALVKGDSVSITDLDGKKIDKEIFEVKWDAQAAEKEGYEHFMLKEIHEQPHAIRDTLAGRLNKKKNELTLKEISLSSEQLKQIKKIFIVACGTAYHAGVVGKYVIEDLLRIPVEVDVASEFRYRSPIYDENMLTIIISQSGETADTLAALREAKRLGSHVIGITNVVGSSVSREADDVIYTWAGPEIAVASTKAYITQLIALYMLTLDFAKKRGDVDLDKITELVDELKEIPQKAQALIADNEPVMVELSEKYKNVEDLFFIGRGLDYAAALEGSLKLKEISYIHAEAYAAGELKHGTLALITSETPVIALATQKKLYEKTASNIKEVKAREASVIGVTFDGDTELQKSVDYVVYLPKANDYFAPILSVIPLQLFSYYTAVARGCDVDKPRNLAKSVTVE